jgi:molybdopterin-guanine dinucleotide biosynthesis protein A
LGSIRAFDAIVLAGGSGSRLGGIDKPALRIGELSLLDRALAAVGGARRISVVRQVDDVPVSRRVSRTVEDPPRSGLASAIAAGLDDLDSLRPLRRAARFVAVLAADLPRVAEAFTVLRRQTIVARTEGLIAVDPTGRDQPLLAIYRTAALRSAIASHPVDGLAVRRLVAGLALTRVRLDAQLCADVDDRADAVAAGIVLPQISGFDGRGEADV